MEDNTQINGVTIFDKDTPKINDAGKVKSVLATSIDNDLIGSVDIDLIIIEAANRVGEIGAELPSVQGGTSEAPTVLIAPSTNEFRWAEASPGEYKFGSNSNMVATEGKLWRIEWIDRVPSLRYMGILPKGINGKTIENFNAAKLSGYSAGDQVLFNGDSIFEVKAGQTATTGQSPTTNPEKFVLIFESSSKSEINSIKDQLSQIGTLEKLTLTWNKYAFNSSLNEYTEGMYQNQGTIIDVSTKVGKTIEILTNSYGTVFSGWKRADGSIINTFQLSENPTAPLITKVPVGADKLYISRFNNFNTKITISERKFAKIEAETNALQALDSTIALKQMLSYLNVNHVKLQMEKGGYFDHQLIRRVLNDTTQTCIYDVTALRGTSIILYAKAFEAAFCGFKDDLGNIIRVFSTTNQNVPNTIAIPTNAKDMYITNYDQNGLNPLESYFLFGASDVRPNNDYIRGFDFQSLSSFFKKLTLKTKTSPINLMFMGDSITNFQVSGDSLDYAVESVNKPAFMYNKETFAYKIWQYLNPNTMDGKDEIVNAFGNMKFIKANSNQVTKGGTWFSNFTGTGYNELGTYESSELRSTREIFHSREIGDFMEITLPSGVIGVSIVAKRFGGTKNYNGTNLSASSMKVFIGGVLKETVSLIGEQTVYFDYAINPATTGNTVVRIENTENNWLPIWGFEYWTDNAIRPINVGLSGNSIGGSFEYGYKRIILNQMPDMIIHEANIINDRNYGIDNAISTYKAYFEDVQSKNIPLIMMITHDTQTKSENHNKFARMVIDLCKAYKIPYVNVWKYLDDKNKGNNLPSSLFIDGVHLSTYGNSIYWMLLKEAFQRNY